ncbi:OsmC family protein [Algibacter sp. 2305UL17-15]|uniref:OsmC family protein n=1 Tax=Algibacter sp. 2305UL17-15 TaxID=3231268 RepID=UPI003459BCA6
MKTVKFAGKHILRKMKVIQNPSVVNERHLRLNDLYKTHPEKAWITDTAEVLGEHLDDPFRTTVTMNTELKVPFKIGVHRAVGGDHDYPNPGDMLCATLASCMESTTRMIANRYNIKLKKTRVKVSAFVDVRGTLRLNMETPVEFQSMHIDFNLESDDLDTKGLKMLVNAVKKSCIIYQTLKKGLPINIDYRN